MRLAISFAALAILVSACAAPAVTTPIPTAIPASTQTPPPSPIPPPTLTPSPTVDPNTPSGATGKDAKGNYTKVENGLSVVWNPELNTWERHLNVNDEGIPLILFNQMQHEIGGMRDYLDLYISVSDRVQGYDRVES